MWYDNDATDLTAQGMQEGVEGSAVFVLFLSAGVFTSTWVQQEVIWRQERARTRSGACVSVGGADTLLSC